MFKINISNKDGKTYKLELESEELIGKQLHDKIDGKDLLADLEGYEFEITGASDKAGFPALENIEGIGLKKVLLSYEKAMKKRPKYEGKKKRSKNKPKGLRLRKTVRGKVISQDITQINLKTIKEGAKKLQEIFPEQAKGKEKENRKTKRTKAKEEAKEAPKPEEEPKEVQPQPEKVEPLVSEKEELTKEKSAEPISEANFQEQSKE